jgi:hypothetical protein
MIAVTATSANRARFQLAPIALTGITNYGDSALNLP